MAKLFLLLLVSCGVTGLTAVPFINLLYKLKFQRQQSYSGFMSVQNSKMTTPVAGGLLIILVSTLLGVIVYQFTKFHLNWTIGILAITFLLFGLLGLYDDLRKFMEHLPEGVFGLRAWHKLIVQLVFGVLIGYLLYHQMGFDSIRFPFGWIWHLGWWYVPFSALVIATTSNAFNITDGMDGLAAGLLVFALIAFWYLAARFATADVVVFIVILTGALVAYLYFNIYPARFMMGDTGALAFGAVLAVIALMSQNVVVLPIIGGVFMVELLSSAIQLTSKALRHGKRVFLVAPLHHHFQALGWEETKVVTRFWLFGILCAFLGLFVALL